ncbi:MAG: hypothetical protein HN855_03270 [Anaerolineae bacterium]|jgi:pheromone shutdown protein TraB|nr:hypothetical protein [Anaerolineae bacterium]MBT7072491.1 hypothetical protein [Anaerolineae bacterium]MBT7324156.1 hypothetical protein [Anaerolineae bacterium]
MSAYHNHKIINIISIVLLLTLLLTVFFYPTSSRILSTIVLVFGIELAIIFTVHRNWESKKSNKLTNIQFTRNTFLDLLGLALTMGAAIWLGRLAGDYAGQAVGVEAGQTWGMIAGIVAGMGAGFAGALIAGRVWGRVSEPLRV